ncbi:hypothetical protein ANN_01620 [Periplaneta americana]|uniref:Uncharacterized protein n=1 Tax=Periplaneta americana TaxID=6978 RepID=A0ABQ8TWH8_PERAM|nr:hypothetical protein ANN_01620 [Periplaneta americana]
MSGLCEDGNELPGSLKAICKIYSIDEISDSEMVFGEMRQGFAMLLPDIRFTVRKSRKIIQPAMVIV